MFWPCETRTSTCLSFATISSGLYRFLAIAVLLDVKDIPQVGPLQWGWITLATNIGADMGGVPNQKDAAHLISLRLTAVDTVVHPPDGITQHATRGPGIEYRLEVLQGWLSQQRMISLSCADIGNQVSASSRQREKGEHTLGSEEKACSSRGSFQSTWTSAVMKSVG